MNRKHILTFTFAIKIRASESDMIDGKLGNNQWK